MVVIVQTKSQHRVESAIALPVEIAREGFTGGLYPYVDFTARTTAILLARTRAER